MRISSVGVLLAGFLTLVGCGQSFSPKNTNASTLASTTSPKSTGETAYQHVFPRR